MKILFLILILIFFCKNVNSIDLFDTLFYNIEFTSNNIDEDKLREINKVKIKSIVSIFKNTLSNEFFEEVNKSLDKDLINTFIKNIVINDEKIINDKYKSKIKVNYNKKRIIDFLRLKEIPYVEYHPDKILLIIYEINKFENNLFSINNQHYRYYNDNLSDNNFFQIPNLDINDRFILNEESIVNKDFKKINNFSKKYKSIENMIVIANSNENKVTYNLILLSNGKILEKKLFFNKNEMDVFFQKLQYETIDLWKNIHQIQNKTLNYLTCRIAYFNIMELKEIRNNLNKVSIINKLNIKNISHKNIEYDINYYGNLNILIKILELNKLKISYNKNECNIRLI